MLSIVKNLSVVTLSELFEKAIIFLLFIYMGRILPVAEFGYLNYLLATLSYFVIFIDLGLPQLATREVASNGTIHKKLFQAIVSIKIVLFMLVGVIWATFSFLYFKEHLGLALFMELYLFARVIDIFWYLQAHHDFTTIAKLKTVKSLLLVSACLVLNFFPSYQTYLYMLVLSLTVPFIYWLFRHNLVAILSPKHIISYITKHRLRMKILLIRSMPLAASTFLILLYYNLDTVLIKYYLGYEEVARYNAAYKLIFAFIVVRSVFTSVIFPRISQKHLAWSEGKIFALIGLGVAVAIAMFSYLFSDIVLELAYGEKYIDASSVFAILSLTASVLWINLFYPIFFIAIKKERFYLKVHIFTALINLLGNIFLIPKYGIEGAAYATLCADVVSLSIFGFFYYGIIGKREING